MITETKVASTTRGLGRQIVTITAHQCYRRPLSTAVQLVARPYLPNARQRTLLDLLYSDKSKYLNNKTYDSAWCKACDDDYSHNEGVGFGCGSLIPKVRSDESWPLMIPYICLIDYF